MANHIYIYCTSTEVPAYRPLVQHMTIWGPEGLVFDPPIAADVKDQPNPDDWTAFDIRWAPDRRPILVERIFGDDLFPEMIEEAIERLDGASGDLARVRAHLKASRQLIHVELGDIPEEIFEMLDATEIYLSDELGGLVGAYEGFFDARLHQIVEFA